jgi:hypothetical protein
MTHITFKTESAHSAFCFIADSLTNESGNTPMGDSYNAILLSADIDSDDYPLTVTIPDNLATAARIILRSLRGNDVLINPNTQRETQAMTTIAFTSESALNAFLSMAEGMKEVREDCEEFDDANSIDDVVAFCDRAAAVSGVTYPLTVTIHEELTDIADSILENCLDSSSGYTPGDDDAADYIFPGDVVVNPPADNTSMRVRAAVTLAMESLSEKPGRDTKRALATLQALLDQMGCEHFGESVDTLCEICDIVIFG